MDLNKLITKRINEYALNGDADFLDQYGFLITMIAKEYAAQQLILSGVVSTLKCDCGNTEDVKNIPICASCYNPHTGEW
tara:strand:+ start:261 stop:497 length:237 start_codon:yes stop_codon:yes gene_type:complete